MSDVVIQAENLGKKYIIGHQRKERYTALRDVLMNGARDFWQRGRHYGKSLPEPDREEFWALQDVSFAIKQGDRVGIIGRNGAGKSTLLKILSRITEPTSGRVRIRGRVASLLEVGTGFHPELTGRENIWLNGAILGMSRSEIQKKFDEIVEFAEVEKFLDTAVKHYSSGMYVRLAFAVAAHLEPEILVVDEVLAVGDAQFQNKCLGKMEDAASSEGKTVLFVSHNLAAIQRLCRMGVYLQSGRIKAYDKLHPVIERYQRDFTTQSNESLNPVQVAPGQAKFTNWEVLDEFNAKQMQTLTQTNSSEKKLTEKKYSCISRERCRFQFTIVSKCQIPSAFVGFAIWSSQGELIFAASSMDDEGKYMEIGEGTYHVQIGVNLPIKAGIYQLDVSLNAPGGQIDRWSAEPALNILPRLSTSLPEIWHGILNEEANFQLYCKEKP